MNDKVKAIIALLKDEIQDKFGKRLLYAADCQDLSEQILSSSKRQVSVSTLKRFFGIIKSPFTPSKYTLDTLAIYLQFDDWQAYVRYFEKVKQRFAQLESWDNFRKMTDLITQKSIESLKNKIGIGSERLPLRSFAEKRFEEFLYSSKIATAIIAPNGYGKSTLVAHLTEKFFTGVNPKYPEDIVYLVDGSIFFNLLNLNQEINGLYNLIDFDPRNSFGVGFRKHPELVKGRIILIIEGIDDIYSTNEKTAYFIDNLLNMISSYENIGWFKLLITCSPNKWRMFSYRIQKNPAQKSFWFGVVFNGIDAEITNIPLLKRKEIKVILERNHFPQSLDDLCFNNPEITDIINNPYLLHLFLSTYDHYVITREIDLLSQYIQNTVLSPPYSEEKFSIIKLFFILCGYGKYSDKVNKGDLNLTPSMILAYNELLKTGILYEYSLNESYLSLSTYVKFSRNNLFAYYLANILVKENELNTDFFRTMIDEYADMPNLLYDIIKYIVKILFKEENIEPLKSIFFIFALEGFPTNSPIFNMPSYVLTNVLSEEMRKDRKLRENLIPWLAQSEVGRTLYFERFLDIDGLVRYSWKDLDFFLQNNQSNEAKQFVCSMKFLQYFLGGNQEQCKTEYANCLNLKFPEGKDSLNASFYFVPQITYQAVFGKKVDENLIRNVYKMSETLLQNGVQNRIEIPYFEFTVIFSLNFGRLNQEIIDLAQYVLEKYDLTELKSSCFYQLFLSVYARALLETGEVPKAIELYEQVKFKNVMVPHYMHNYIKIRYHLIQAQFLIYQGKFKKARKKLEQIKMIAQLLEFSYFYNNALAMEKLFQ